MILTKAVSILVFVLSALAVKATASDTLVAIFNRQQFVQGDTLNVEVYIENYKAGEPAQTLHLWIDDTKTGRRWKYRYPFLKGRQKIALKISDSIPMGNYAFNFLLQKQFLTIKGKILNAVKQDTAINFVAKTKNKIPIIDGADVQPTGYFKIDELFYTDTVLFSFSRSTQKKENPLKIFIETPVDSLFTPAAIVTEYITLGNENIKNDTATNSTYNFNIAGRPDSKLLTEVILQAKAKKALQEYTDRYVSGLFANEDARVFDFLENEDALSYPDLLTYLTVKIPGLVQKTNSETGRQYLTYRNETVDIYVDEFNDDIHSVNIQDIAMVKFFGQSLRLGGGLNDDGFGGSIAIYTKKPQDKKGNKLSNYTFFVKGYSPKYATWK